jgi:hypothetical protein
LLELWKLSPGFPGLTGVAQRYLFVAEREGQPEITKAFPLDSDQKFTQGTDWTSIKRGRGR